MKKFKKNQKKPKKTVFSGFFGVFLGGFFNANPGSRTAKSSIQHSTYMLAIAYLSYYCTALPTIVRNAQFVTACIDTKLAPWIKYKHEKSKVNALHLLVLFSCPGPNIRHGEAAGSLELPGYAVARVVCGQVDHLCVALFYGGRGLWPHLHREKNTFLKE